MRDGRNSQRLFVFGEFVYFFTFPGKIQSFQFLLFSVFVFLFREFVYFWTFPGKNICALRTEI